MIMLILSNSKESESIVLNSVVADFITIRLRKGPIHESQIQVPYT